MKKCSKCGLKKPRTTEFFNKRSDTKDGFRADCINCRSLVSKEYIENNRDEINHRQRERYKENREQVLEDRRKYQQENKEQIAMRKSIHYQENKKEINAKFREYYKNNKKEISIRQKQHYQENREEILEKGRKYQRENLDVFRKGNQRRRAKEKKQNATLTVRQWVSIKTDFSYKCAYCGMSESEHRHKWSEQLNQEHFISLSSGGGYTHNNIIPSCKSCNSSKNNKDFFEWYPNYEHYSREREQFILEYLGYTDNTQQLALF